MMVLWLLMLRAIGIEFRTHLESQVWRSFFDGIFSVASMLLAIFFGAALGNVVRGVPLNSDGYFFEPLWTNWRVGPHPGILDWYTVLAGVMALATLTMHGALYIAHKTDGAINERARRIALVTWPVVLALTFISLMLTIRVHLDVVANYKRWPIGLAIPLIVFASLAGVLYFATSTGRRRRSSARPPTWRACWSAPRSNLSRRSAGGDESDQQPDHLQHRRRALWPVRGPGVVVVGIVIAIGYFVFVYRMFKGKVVLEAGEGH